MGRRARNIRKAQKNQARQKKKAAKQARFAAAQEAQRNFKAEKKGRASFLFKIPERDRRRIGGTISLKTFCKLIGA